MKFERLSLMIEGKNVYGMPHYNVFLEIKVMVAHKRHALLMLVSIHIKEGFSIP
jgi:hypothetical protein